MESKRHCLEISLRNVNSNVKNSEILSEFLKFTQLGNSRVGILDYTSTYFLMKYVLNPCLVVCITHSVRNPRDVETRS